MIADSQAVRTSEEEYERGREHLSGAEGRQSAKSRARVLIIIAVY